MSQTINRAQSGYRYQTGANLVVINCGVCAIQFAVPSDWHSKLVQTREWFYCPRGCKIHYSGESEAEKLKRQLDDSRAHAGRLASQREQLQSSLSAQRGATTRARNQRDKARAEQAAGVCPCCGKEFKVLVKHMKRVHPEFPTPIDD